MISKLIVRWQCLTGALALTLAFAAAASGQVVISGSLPTAGDVGVLYSGSLSAVDGGDPCNCTWSISGTPPDGVTIDPSTGSVSGTPGIPGPFSFTVTATNASLDSDSRTVSGTINPAPAITPESLPAGQVGTPYSVSISVTNGTPPYGDVQLTGTLPTGLNFIGGLLSGTPTQTGPFSLTATVTDSVGRIATANYSLQINPAPPPPPTITTPASLPQGEVTAPYSQTLAASGGTGSGFTWTITTGSVPGLSLSPGGVLSGTPTTPGLSHFTANVTDSGGGSATQDFTLNVIAGPSITTAAILPPGTATTPYSQTLAATGGTDAGFTWTITAGSLPSDLSLSAAGVLSGTPTTPGLSHFTAKVTDSGGGSASLPFALTINSGLSITTPASLPPGEVTAPYSQTLAATGGTGAGLTWTVTAGTLPPGLSLSAAGAITGTPTTTGLSNFTAKVTDSGGGSASQAFTLNIIAGPSITTAAILPPGTATTPYSQTLAATGGTGAGFTWAVTLGSLPSGLSLSAAGAITGTPTTTGLSHFTATVTDSGGGSASQAFALNINSGLSITTPASLPPGEATAPYSQTLAATGGSGAGLTWTVTAGTLPLGLSLSAGGAITGTPTTTGLSNFTAKVTDSGGGSASQAFTLNIIGGPSISTTSPLPQGEVTAPYSRTLAASGGTAAGFTWTVASGSLPAGLSLSTGGAITGTPTAAGPSNFTLQVTDSAGGKASQPFTLDIIAGPAITTNPTLTKGEVGAAYSQTLSASGGSNAGFVWSLASGSSLPAGLSLSAAGVLSGTPTAAALGTDSFSVRVTDSANGVATLALSITIVAGPTITTAPTLPNGTVGVAYTKVTLAASDGTPPYVWSITLGSLPQGLSLDSSAGTITGTPTTATGGAANFTVQLRDAKSVPATKQFSITIAAGLTITTAPGLPNATIGVPYSATASAGGGTPPYTWSVTTGSLPTGLTLNSTTGAISGLPSSSGSFQFTMQVTDSSSVTATKQFTLGVAQALAITTLTLPSGATGTPYSQALGVSGGSPPYTWTIIAGVLPSGLGLSASSGVISGTPASSGTFTFTVQVRDSNSVTASQQFNLTAVSGLVITTPQQLLPGAVNSPYSQILAAAGGTAPYTWVLAQGTLPAGLTLSGGVITGTPKTAGTLTFSVQVTDHVGATATKQFTLTIAAGLTITSGAALPQGTIGVAYPPLTLAAVGGAQPYTWSLTVASGPLPAGLSLSSTGVITGTPTKAGAFDFTAQVKDSNGATATLEFTISIVPLNLPQVTVGVPQTSPAAQQISFGLSLASGYPLDITGQITMSFQADAVAPAVDPAMQFSTGGTTVSFTIPANSTKAVFSSSSQLGLQTGTVSGTITLSFALEAGGTQLLSTGLDRTITIPRSVPAIQSVKLVRTSAGLEVHVVGFSSSRDLTEADLTFTAAPGATLQTTKLTVDLGSVATAWYKSTGSMQYGSQLMLVLPFTASQGSVDAVGSVSVVLKNAEGSSQSANGTL